MKNLKRSASFLLSFIMLISAFVICADIPVRASGLVVLPITNVTRKYTEAGTLLSNINSRREASELDALVMDTTLMELAFRRAVELSIYNSAYSPDGTDCTNHATESRGQIYSGSVTNLNNVLSISSSNEVILDGSATAVGIGVVMVHSKKFVCIITSDKHPRSVGASALTQADEVVEEEITASTDRLGTISLNYSDNKQFYCGVSPTLYLVVHSSNSSTDALIDVSECNVSSSDTSVFSVSGTTVQAIAPGTSDITLSLRGYPSVTATATYKVISKSMNGATISSIPTQYYTGSAITPDITVTLVNGTVLTMGTDYSVEYSNNINVGTATVTVKGINQYTGNTLTANFSIVNDPTAFRVTISAAETEVAVGDSTNISTSVTNGTSPITYTFEQAPQGTSSYTSVQSAGTSSTCTYSPTSQGTYNVRVTAKDSANKTATSVVSITVYPAFTVNASVSAARVPLGNDVTITPSVTGGIPPYTYSYYAMENGASSWTAIAENVGATSYAYTPRAVGRCSLKVVVKGKTGKTKNISTAITVYDPNVTNNSTISATSTAVGRSLTLTGAASGGTGSYTYLFRYMLSNGTSWTTIGTSSPATFTPPSAGTYIVQAVATDSSGTSSTKEFTVTVAGALTNTSTVNKTTIAPGESVTISPSASGGTGGYSYQYSYSRGSSTSFSIFSGTTFSPSTAGTYTLRVIATDSSGSSAAKDFTITVQAALTNNSTISSAEIIAGQTVTLTGAASGGSGGYTYKYYYKRTTATSWSALSGSASASLTPSASGNFDLRVDAADSAGTTSSKSFRLSVYAAVTNKTTVNKSALTVGETATFTGAATGGGGMYTYQFFYRRISVSTWTAFGSSTSADFKPSAGTFYVRTYAKDRLGSTSVKDFKVTASTGALVNSCTVSKANINVGENITVTGAASGGTTDYSYQFSYKRNTASAWTDFGSNGTGTFKPSAAGTFTIKTVVKDTAGTSTEKLITVTASSGTLVNKCTINNAHINAGDALTVTGAASGGTTTYSYQFYYKRSNAANWTAFGSGTSGTINPGAAGTLTIRTYAKDSAGASALKDFTVTVSSGALVNKCTVNKSNINVGETITVTGAASGGTTVYSYQFYYKRSTATTWTAFGSGTSGSFKPSAAGTFNIRTYAKDNAGASTLRDFTVTASAGALVNKCAVNKTNISVGEKFTVTGAASGGTGTYSYQFYYKRSTATSWTAFGSGTSGSFKPSAAGTFNIRTYAKDNAGASTVRDFTVTASAGALVNKCTINNEHINAGDVLTVTGAASGGTGTYSYQFYYKRSTATNWTAFGSGTSGSFKPSAAGTFNIRTYAKDNAGASTVKDFTVTISAGALVNKCTINSASIKAGNALTVTGAASGGTGTYSYQFYYKRSTATNWTAFGSGTSGTIKPGSAGTLTIRTYAKDNAGASAVKDFTVTVTQ